MLGRLASLSLGSPATPHPVQGLLSTGGGLKKGPAALPHSLRPQQGQALFV